MKHRKIFGLGLSRTGTSSLADALTKYGFKTIHNPQLLFVRRADFGLSSNCVAAPLLFKYTWARQYERECLAFSEPVSDYLGRYDAFVDLPVPMLYKQLSGRFPDARFIYTKRDPTKWLESMSWLMSEGAAMWEAGPLFQEINFAMYRTKVFDRQKLIRAYDAHQADIDAFFADRPGSLLTIDIGEEKSVASLVRFLGLTNVNVNDPYPKSNIRHSVSWYAKYRQIYLARGLKEPSASRWLGCCFLGLNNRWQRRLDTTRG